MKTMPMTAQQPRRPDVVLASAKHFRAANDAPAGSFAGLEASACIGHDPELWFPITPDGLAEPVAICQTCPRIVDCLNGGIAMQAVGVWGGRYLKNGKPFDMRPVGRPANQPPAA
ncbi:WhiB family transcriptional regulator [Nostocoides jenkinsii]|jgi:hypothetical protein|nr:WhiB family transcriptional regulator [Tetrasphaera jenkinsii]